MTEKEKMLRGMLFTPSHDKELLADLVKPAHVVPQ